MDPIATPALVVAAILLVIVAGVLAILFAVKIFTWIGYAIGHVFRFVSGEVMDVLRVIGATVTGLLMVPMVLGNVVIGRWSAAAHYGRGVTGEIRNVALSAYRIFLGHPARFLGLTALTEGVEKRMPVMVAQAPGADAPSKRTGQFEGYKIVGSLPGGGSGSKLYVAEPDATKRAVFARMGRGDLSQVVIKSFSMQDGSSLPQIVRESRSLDAAKKLGLVLDHDLTPDRFFYVMEFVPGQSLSIVTQQLHTASAPGGLDANPLRSGTGYVVDLLKTLDTYHRGGLWHKDVKPDNIIVDGSRAHLVDFGLITPLRSAMTLTTHGTEYFRDPELVRLALKGVKVQDVDGTRFDIFAVGAVLYSVIENSFPAHGVLSQITKRCPDAVRWIVRRAMTDYDKRYPTAAAMAEDLIYVATNRDPFVVKPFELPSMRAAGGVDNTAPSTMLDPEIAAVAAAHSPRGAGVAAEGEARGPRTAPKLTLTNWWTGAHKAEGAVEPRVSPAASVLPFAAPEAAGMAAGVAAGMAAGRSPLQGAPRRSAQEQLTRARARVDAARARGLSRASRRVKVAKPFDTRPNVGVVMVSLLVLVGFGIGVTSYIKAGLRAQGPTKAFETVDGQEVYARDGGVDGEQAWSRVVAIVEPAMPVMPVMPDLPVTSDLPAVPAGPTLRAHSGVARSLAVSRPAVYEIGRDSVRTPQANAGASVTDAAAELPRSDGHVLVVVDLPKPLSPANKAAVARLVGRLGAAGFSVDGDYPGNSAGADAMKSQLELTARAIAECGQAGPDSEVARKLLGDWIARTSGVDLTLWVRRSDFSKDSVAVEYFVVGPTFKALGANDAERARARFEVALNVLQKGA